MKTLKKTLCLVLAVVMVVGVLILPAYAADDDYDVAIEALQNYGVLQGYPDGDLHTDANITRGMMAALVYRIMTGDTESTDAQVALKYGNYANIFTDADVAPWAKGYIGFCANKGVLKGYESGAIQANKQISGYEVMAMLLRALGYDHNNEYTGNNWKYNVLSDATKSGISKNVTRDPETATPRGAVAQYTYDAATQTDRVAPTLYPNVGYASIGEKLINIGASTPDYDQWGAPSTIYTLTYTWPDYDVVKNPSIADEPLLESWEPVTQAAVYKAAGLNEDAKTLAIYLNGKENTTTSQDIDATSLDVIGGQGRWTRIYEDRIVEVDTFLSKVVSVTDAVTVNGKEAISASYEVTAYYNNYADSAQSSAKPIADAANKNEKSGTLLGKAPISFAKGDVLASYGVSTEKDGSAFDTDDQLSSLVSPAKVTTASVTVNAIVKDKGASETGIIGTNGKTYLYNCTYSYNGDYDTDNSARLTDDAIGTTYTLYLDANGNILGVEPAAKSEDKGVGVVVAADAGRIKGGQYYGEVTVLTSENKQVKVKFIQATAAGIAGLGDLNHTDGNKPYTTEDNAAQAAELIMGQLISWEPEDADGYEDYSALAFVDNGEPTDIGTSSNGKIDAGDAEAIKTDASLLLNDDTVFFIANYKMQNSKGGWVFTNYSVVKGFQAIQDLGTSGTIVENPNVCVEDNEFKVEALDYDADGVWADYVLVINAVNKSTNDVEDVKNYAYLADPDAFVKVYDDYYQYDAVINGKAHQPLRVNYDGVSGIDNFGLYTYSEYTNDGWKKVEIGTDNTFVGGQYYYKSGVIWNTNPSAMSGANLNTVAKDAAIYLVDPATGSSVKVDAKLGTVMQAYKNVANNIWWQTNKYGWIDVIYVEVPDIGEGTPGAEELTPITAATISLTATSGAIETLKSIDAVKLEATSLSPSSSVKSVSIKWQRIETTGGTRWIDCEAGEVFNDGWTYQAIVTVTAAKDNKFEGSSVGSYTLNATGLEHTVVAADISSDGQTLSFIADVTVS